MNVNKKNVEKWVKALKSGRYKKTTEVLERFGAFCALGVACKEFEKDTGQELSCEEWENESGTLPGRVKKWLGINSGNPKICVPSEYGKICDSIIKLNDMKIGFKVIAKGIKDRFIS